MIFTRDVKYIMLTFLMHIVIGLFTAESYIVFFFKNARLYDLPEGKSD